MPDQLGPVVITARDIYDELVLVRRSVDKLVTDHEDAVRQLSDHEARLRAVERLDAAGRLTDYEARLRTLERARWPLPSLAALVAVAALLVSVLPYVGPAS